MAKDKNSFILYKDQRIYFDKLSDDDAGKLIKHIFKYISDEDPKPENMVIDLSFEPFKLSLKRDLKKYESIIERNKVNGLKGGRPKKPKKPSGLSGNPKNPSKPKKADSDSVNDSVSDIKERYKVFISQFNEIKGTKFKGSEKDYPNFIFWLGQYEPIDIIQAVKNHDDTFWADKINPQWLFRTKAKGQPVDYIGQLLQHTPKPNIL